jgi:hypothetical protein
MQLPIPIHIPRNLQVLRIERIVEGYWRMWIHTRDFKHGTCVLMHDNGKMEQVTIREDQGDDVRIIKPEDK